MNKVIFSAPEHYRIEVQGCLRTDWSDRFGSMQLSFQKPEGNPAITILQGKVSGQAELAGILYTLYELHLSLLSVQRLNDE
jgi:hypothetical protein